MILFRNTAFNNTIQKHFINHNILFFNKSYLTTSFPLISNGGRTRNLPQHDSAKWIKFKEYNRRDVEVEMSIQKRLSKYPAPEQIWDEYHLDQEINDRGIALDMVMVENAILFDERSRSDLTASMQDITGVDNPNNVAQMKQWLSDNEIETESLEKKNVAKLIEDTGDKVEDALRLRLQLAKSSVKKYQAMQNAVCKDGRTHGMFQFYGANRSGRWTGRLIQLPNLPQNHMKDLAEVREIVRSGDYETMELLYDDIPDVLSQLIRTAFVARDGYKFIVSDFSAIEARVLAFLTSEKWRSKVFAEGKTSTALAPARCSASLSKSTGSTATSGRREKSRNSPSDTADLSVP